MPGISFEAYFNERNMNNCKTPVIETSFLASVPRHKFVNLWIKGMNAVGCSNEQIKNWWKLTKHKNSAKWLDPQYHYVYHVNQRILQKHDIASFEGMHLKSDTFYKYMPLSVIGPTILVDRSYYSLAHKNMSELNFGTFFKLTHFERAVTDNIVMASNTSFAYKYLFRPF